MKYLYILLAILLPAAVLAQSNYSAGYVLKNNGDTVRGYINYREWTESPKRIDFKVNKTDRKDITFDPLTLKGFGVNGVERYVSFTGVVTTGKNEFPELSIGIDSAKALDTLFLRQVTTGKYLTLYSQRDRNKKRLFIAEANGEPVELIFYSYYNDVKQVVSSVQYKGQLLLVINKYGLGSSRLTDQINTVTYDEAYLEPLVNKINGPGKVVKKKNSRIYAGISINATGTEVSNIDLLPTPNKRNSTTVSPKINFGIDLFNNPQVQQFIFRAEASLSYITPRFNYPVTVSSTSTSEVYEFNQYTATITPQLLLNVYNNENFKFYVDAGVGFNLSAYSNNKFTIKSNDPAVVNSVAINKPYNLEPFWANFPFQAGIVLNKRIEICATYTPYNSYTKYSSFYASNRSFDLGVKLYLDK